MGLLTQGNRAGRPFCSILHSATIASSSKAATQDGGAPEEGLTTGLHKQARAIWGGVAVRSRRSEGLVLDSLIDQHFFLEPFWTQFREFLTGFGGQLFETLSRFPTPGHTSTEQFVPGIGKVVWTQFGQRQFKCSGLVEALVCFRLAASSCDAHLRNQYLVQRVAFWRGTVDGHSRSVQNDGIDLLIRKVSRYRMVCA